jgi:hypothetical protein
VNELFRTRFAAMHESAERAVNAARLLGHAPLTAAALAMLALADSMTGAAEQAESNRAEAMALFESLSDAELARHLEAGARLAGVERYLDRYADADAQASAADWPKPASCSMVGSRRRACWTTPTPWNGAFPAVPPPRCE